MPDYELADTVAATTPQQLRALADPTRRAILDLVLERAATTTELAEALGKPKGTVDHHLKALAGAGMVAVVRTRQVRATTERFWGRTGRTIMFGPMAPTPADGPVAGTNPPSHSFIREALEESERVQRPDGDEGPGFTTLRHARITADRVREFTARLEALALEFASAERGGDTMYGLLVAVYPTDLPVLPEARR